MPDTVTSSSKVYPKYRWVIWAVTAILALLAFSIPFCLTSDSTNLLTSPTDRGDTPRIRQDTSDSGSYFAFYSLDPENLSDVPQLITETDAIVIGEIGEVLAREYPNAYLQDEYTAEEWESLTEDSTFLESRRTIFFEFQVQETLRGVVPERFPLLSLDVERYAYTEITQLKTGEEVLIFLYIEPASPNVTKLYDTLYSYTDNGLFDIEGNRAYPRQPIAFEDTDKNYYHQTNDPLRPYFELGKLKAEIQNHGK